MSRPTEPQKKEELLERCLAAAIEVGALDSSINAIAKRIGTSGRMLVYHFGSKQELERQLIGLLETRLREKLWSFQGVSLEADSKLLRLLRKLFGSLNLNIYKRFSLSRPHRQLKPPNARAN